MLWRRPSREAVLRRLANTAAEPLSYRFDESFETPRGFVHDWRTISLGREPEVWQRARESLASWRMFDQPRLQLIGGGQPPEKGLTVAVLAPMLGLWWLNLSRVVRIVDESEREGDRFGFVYVTLRQHVVRGQECFEIWRQRRTGEVSFRIEALSRPSRWYLWPGYPLMRRAQRRFAEGALAAMRRAAADSGEPGR